MVDHRSRDLPAPVEDAAPGPMAPREDTWIVVPAYNEERAIAAVVGELRAEFPNVVVVDDGSRDSTVASARRAGALVLEHAVNLGQGAALQTGMTFALDAGARRIATYDADGQHRPSDLAALIDALEEGVCDIALGSRFLADAGDVPAPRRLMLSLAVRFTRFMTAMPVTDTHNGLRAFTRQAALGIELKNNRMAHASELLDQIARMGLPYRELPVRIRYTEYSLSKGQRSTDAVRVLFEYLTSRLFD